MFTFLASLFFLTASIGQVLLLRSAIQVDKKQIEYYQSLIDQFSEGRI